MTAVALSGGLARVIHLGGTGFTLVYRTSSDGGAHWSSVGQVATLGSGVNSMGVGLGGAGTVVAWQEHPDLGSTGNVHTRHAA